MTRATPAPAGSFSVLEGATANVHTYTAPESGFLVNTHIVEGETRLVVFDARR